MRLIDDVRRRRGREVIPITVVVPTLNRRDRLEETLDALRRQTYPLFEVVVVNGPSTDGTAEMVKGFASRARVLTCPEASATVSRNIGVQNGAGDIIALIDDDAIPRPDWLEQLAAPFGDERVGAVGGPVFDVPLDRVEWKVCTSTRLGVVDTDSPGPIGRYQGVGSDPFAYFAGCNMALRRSVVHEVGGFNAAMPYVYDDAEFCCRLHDAGYRVEYVESALVRHYRAVSAMRDGQQIITDPYTLALGRIVFASHCQSSPDKREEVFRLAGQWEQEWVAHASAHVASGRFSRKDYHRFVERAALGTAEGVTRGRRPRPFTTIGPPPLAEFRQYR
ncbi:MAG: glycosyltransferase [Actinobacteria bacterium]|nr:glycosyltransferase [Actinomycetota bacterium]